MKVLLAVMLAYDKADEFEVAWQITMHNRKHLMPHIDLLFYYRKTDHRHFLFAEKVYLMDAITEAEGYDYYGILDTDVIVRDDAVSALFSAIENNRDAWIFAMDECLWGGYWYLSFEEFYRRMVKTFNLNGIAVNGIFQYVNAGLILFKGSVAKKLCQWWLWFLRNGLYKDGWLEQHALTALIHFLELRDKYVSLSPEICAFADKQPYDAPFVHIFASTQLHRLKEFVLKLLSED